MSSITSGSPSRSSPITLENCINDASLSMECLALRRELQNVKNIRERDQRLFAKVRNNCQVRMGIVSKRLDRITHRPNMNHYITAVKMQYDSVPTPYVLRKHAELLKYIRHEELFDTYIRIMEKQNREMIQQMETYLLNMMYNLKVEKQRVSTINGYVFHSIARRLSNDQESGVYIRLNSMEKRRRATVHQLFASEGSTMRCTG